MDMDTRIDNIMGMRVDNYNLYPYSTYNVPDEVNVFDVKFEDMQNEYGIPHTPINKTLSGYQYNKINQKLYTWITEPQGGGKCVVITMQDRESLNELIIVANYESMRTYAKLQKLESGFKILELSSKNETDDYASRFSIGQVVEKIYVDTTTGEIHEDTS